jgi:hypothetical protein
MFAQRLAGHSAARITRALNDAAIPCPSAADPKRNPHRSGQAWTLRTVAAILANPRYTGRQVWNRQRTDADLVDPANTGLGHRPVQRWNLPAGWVISSRPAHRALVSEADFIAAQDATAPRGPAGPATRRRFEQKPDCRSYRIVNARDLLGDSLSTVFLVSGMLIGTAIRNADAIHMLLESRATFTLGPWMPRTGQCLKLPPRHSGGSGPGKARYHPLRQARVLAVVGALSQG